MIPSLRKKFNAEFTQAAYEALVRDVNTATYFPADFRISETPLFLSAQVTEELVQASNEIVASLQTEKFRQHSTDAIPAGLEVPGEDGHTTFLQLDFALCGDGEGNIVPRLIELQGFPTVYCFQHLLDVQIRNHYSIPGNLTPYFNDLNSQSYVRLLRDVIAGEASPENTVLLEIEPEKQKTRIDFACTEDLLGVRPVCITKIIKRQRRLYYRRDGKEIPIERIYNRVIFDELQKKDLRYEFRFTDDLDVKWIGHPNWYFKISKHTLPFVTSPYAPPCTFLDNFDAHSEDLAGYVLKPLYSFAGAGVRLDVTRELLDSIHDKRNYILQKKVDYAPLIETPDGWSKAEIRMMFIWQDRPLLVNSLVRMSKGSMMGVAFNKDKTWVGSSVGYHLEKPD
jgi:hypothetical protein